MAKPRLKKKVITVNKLIEDYLEEKKQEGLSNKTLQNYHYSLKVLNSYFDELPLSDLNQEQIEHFVKWYISARQTTNQTKNAEYRNINAFLSHLYEKGFTREHLKINYLKETRKVKEIPTAKQIVRIVQEPDFNDFIEAEAWLMSIFAISLGLRVSSIINIRLEHIDFKEKKLKIVHMKNKNQMVFPLSSTLRKSIKTYLDYIDTDDYLFTKCNGEPLTQSLATNYCKKYYSSLGYDWLHIHCLRHYFASNWMKQNGSIFQLSLALNHSSVSITQRYLRSLSINDFDTELENFKPF